MEIRVTLAPPSECVEQPNTRQTFPGRPYYRTVALTRGINQQAWLFHGDMFRSLRELACSGLSITEVNNMQ